MTPHFKRKVFAGSGTLATTCPFLHIGGYGGRSRSSREGAVLSEMLILAMAAIDGQVVADKPTVARPVPAQLHATAFSVRIPLGFTRRTGRADFRAHGRQW